MGLVVVLFVLLQIRIPEGRHIYLKQMMEIGISNKRSWVPGLPEYFREGDSNTRCQGFVVSHSWCASHRFIVVTPS